MPKMGKGRVGDAGRTKLALASCGLRLRISASVALDQLKLAWPKGGKGGTGGELR